jgi:hypothetical protein
MQLPQPLNVGAYEPMDEVQAIPEGIYDVVLVSSLLTPTKDNPNNAYLDFVLEIKTGPLTGKQQHDRLNVVNPNPQTVDIAFKKIASYGRVTGVHDIQDTRQLENIPFKVKIGPQKGDATYSEVKALYDQHGNPPSKAGSGPQQPLNAPPALAPTPAPPAQPAATWGQAATQQAPQTGWAPGPAANPTPVWPSAPVPTAAPFGATQPTPQPVQPTAPPFSAPNVPSGVWQPAGAPPAQPWGPPKS